MQGSIPQENIISRTFKSNLKIPLQNTHDSLASILFKTSGFWYTLNAGGGGGFFHGKGTWGCAAREGILFRTPSLAKGVLFGNFSRVKSRQGYAFWEFWSKRC